MSWHKRFFLSFLFLLCLFFAAQTTDAMVNPKSLFSAPGTAIAAAFFIVVFTGMLWHGDDK